MGERLAWYRYQVLIHDNIPHSLQALFRVEWNQLYAARGYPWTEDAVSGQVFLEGSGRWVSVALPGTAHFRAGKSDAHTTGDWHAAGVAKGSRFRFGTFEAKLRKDPTPPGLHHPSQPGRIEFDTPYPGPDEPAADRARILNFGACRRRTPRGLHRFEGTQRRT